MEVEIELNGTDHPDIFELLTAEKRTSFIGGQDSEVLTAWDFAISIVLGGLTQVVSDFFGNSYGHDGGELGEQGGVGLRSVLERDRPGPVFDVRHQTDQLLFLSLDVGGELVESETLVLVFVVICPGVEDCSGLLDVSNGVGAATGSRDPELLLEIVQSLLGREG